MAARNPFDAVSGNESDAEELSYARTNFDTDTRQMLDDDGHDAGAGQPSKESCACCFSARTAFLAVLITIGVVLSLILILDLTIMEVERTAQREWDRDRGNWNSNDDIDSGNSNRTPRYEYTFTMNGTDKSDTMDQFLWIPNKRSLVHLRLSNVEISPVTLLTELQYAQSTVKTISLVNVTIFGRMGVQDDILLRDLQYYKLELNQPIGPREMLRFKNRNCSVSDLSSALTFSTFQEKDCLRSLIFFQKDRTEWRRGIDVRLDRDITRVYRLNATIHITLFGFHLFTLDKDEGELTSVLGYSQEILENLLRELRPSSYLELKKLNLRTCPLKLSTLAKFADQLTQLHLGSINFNEPDPKQLSATISKFKQLRRLYFMGSGHFPKEMEQIDLVDVTANVRELRLGLVEIDYRNNITLMNTKFALDHLYLHHIGIKNPAIINKFHEIVDTKKIFFDGKNFGRVPFSRFEFWLNIMKMPAIEFVLFDDSTSFPFLGRVSPASEQFQTAAINATIQAKLTEMGVDINIGQAFVLKKNNVTGKWEGRNYDSTNDKDTFALYLEGGNVDETFINIDTFLKLRFSGASRETAEM